MVYAKMWMAIGLALAMRVATVRAHLIEFDRPGHETQCFFEHLSIGDQMTLTWQSGADSPTNLAINVWLSDPRGIKLYDVQREDTGQFSFTAQNNGRYEYCFFDPDHATDQWEKTVSFNARGIIYVDDEGIMTPLDRDVRDLVAGVRSIKDEHEYLVLRDRMHQKTAESTKRRVGWWALAQILMLVSICGVQIFFVKHHFEVRRQY